MKKFIEKIRKSAKKAQSLVEYGLILGLVAVVAISALQMMGDKVSNITKTSTDAMQSASDNSLDNWCESQESGSTWDATAGKCKSGS